MDIKIIDASDVIEGRSRKKKVTKVVKKPVSEPVGKPGSYKTVDVDNLFSKGGVKKMPLLSMNSIKPTSSMNNMSNVRSDASNVDTGTGTSNVAEEKATRVIRAIKLKEDIYYGPGEANKKEFVKLYKKKELALRWIEGSNVNGEIVNSWINQDRSQYIIKLPEEGGYKRFKFFGCDEIYNYFMSLGAIPFDCTKENVPEATYLTDVGKSNVENKIDSGDDNRLCDDHFIGADLWSGYRTRQLLKDMPDYWGVIWK